MTEEAQLFCPKCGRDYELPKRHMKAIGDHDYSPIPRLLTCLHSLCHSCIEEQYQENENHMITCQTCNHSEAILQTDLVPLDFSLLKNIVAANSTEMLAMCARCYDAVPSTSWCETCSSALCEFHHQDHKLSVDTSKHSIHTFNEHLEIGRHIVYKFPPISCPHCPLQDCSLYCHSCLHLISPKAMIDHHHNHNVSDYVETVPEMKTLVKDAVEQAKVSRSQLDSKVKELRHKLQKLHDSEQHNLHIIERTFHALQTRLKKREDELVEKLLQSCHSHRDTLQHELDALVEYEDNYQRIIQTGEQLLRDTQQSGEQENVEQMYLVAAADTVEFRIDQVTKRANTILAEFQENKHHKSHVEFIKEDLKLLQGVIHRLGVVDSTVPIDHDHHELSSTLAAAVNADDEKDEEDPLGDMDYALHFVVDIREEQAIKKKTNLPKKRSSLRSKLPRSHSEDDGNNEQVMPTAADQQEPVQQVISIEARLLPKTVQSAAYPSHHRSQDSARTSSSVITDEDDDHEQHNANGGVLIGKIELRDRIDKILLGGHKMKSYFESVKDNNDGGGNKKKMPTLRIFKEIVFNSIY